MDMKAVRIKQFGDISCLELEMISRPVPREDEVLTKVFASTVTPLDTYLRSGLNVGAHTPKLPYTPGAAFSGVVEAVGSSVTSVKLGDRVYGRSRSGANAEYTLSLGHQTHHFPADIDFQSAAQISVPYETAYHALVQLAEGHAGETVLVQGAAGSVGSAAVQIARARGFQVFATCSSRDIESVLQTGAHYCFDYRDPENASHIHELTRARGIDIVIEVQAKTNLSFDFKVVGQGGRIVVVGGAGNAEADLLKIISHGIKILGVNLRSLSREQYREIHAYILAGLENKTLRPHAHHSFPLDEIRKAHEFLESGKASGGLSVLS